MANRGQKPGPFQLEIPGVLIFTLRVHLRPQRSTPHLDKSIRVWTGVTLRVRLHPRRLTLHSAVPYGVVQYSYSAPYGVVQYSYSEPLATDPQGSSVWAVHEWST
eukprot:8459558-Pyramimonas_sp.AAC.2